MTRNAKISLALVAALLIGGASLLLLASGSAEEDRPTARSRSQDRASGTAQLLRPDSHRLSTAETGNATLVEFLDFECESCRAVFPVLEELRAKYRDRLTFVIRYFPNPGHHNGQLAAQAVEAAARQGKLEPMYREMFRTQPEWGEAQESKATTFVGLARELGLDVERFRADMTSERVKDRVIADLNDGLALGVEGTPTLFLNGRMLELSTVEQLEADIRAAIGER